MLLSCPSPAPLLLPPLVTTCPANNLSSCCVYGKLENSFTVAHSWSALPRSFRFVFAHFQFSFRVHFHDNSLCAVLLGAAALLFTLEFCLWFLCLFVSVFLLTPPQQPCPCCLICCFEGEFDFVFYLVQSWLQVAFLMLRCAAACVVRLMRLTHFGVGAGRAAEQDRRRVGEGHVAAIKRKNTHPWEAHSKFELLF